MKPKGYYEKILKYFELTDVERQFIMSGLDKNSSLMKKADVYGKVIDDNILNMFRKDNIMKDIRNLTK